MSYDQIWTALDARAALFTAGGDIVSEGDYYDPVEGRPYVLTKLAAYERSPAGVGPDCVIVETGSYMVSLRRPAEEGRGAASELADQVVALFPRSLALVTASGQQISLVSATAMPAIPAGAWLTVPVMIRWFTSL